MAPKALKESQKRRVSCEIANVNKAMAEHILASCRFALQRDLGERNIRRLASEIENGWYVAGSPLFFAVLPDGGMLLLNGQHSLSALIRATETTKRAITLPLTHIYHPVETVEEAGHIYSRLDIHRVRSWHDAYKAAGLEAMSDIDLRYKAALGASLRMIAAKFKGDDPNKSGDIRRSREMQLAAFRRYLPYAEAYVAALGPERHNLPSVKWKRAAVMGVALELYRCQPKKAEIFFTTTAADDGLARGDPRKMLRDYITYTPNHEMKDRKLTARAVAQAWNAWYGGKPLAALQPAKMTDLYLSGTPWTTTGDYDPFADFAAAAASETGVVSYAYFQTGERVEKSGAVTKVTEYVGA